MIDLSMSLEVRHRKLEARDGLRSYTLILGDKTHDVFLPADGSLDVSDKEYLLQRASSLRWITGYGELDIQDHPAAAEVLKEAFTLGGRYDFEVRLFSREKNGEGPADRVSGTGALNVFLDLGGSTLKGLLFSNEQLACQLSESWQPFQMTSMLTLIEKVQQFILTLLGNRSAELVSCVGISSAGICEDGALSVTSLTQGMIFSEKEPYDSWFLKRLIQKLFPNASYRLINDGAVTSLPTRKGQSWERNVLSLVMGSNLGGGHSGQAGIHEMGFVPFIAEGGAVDEWSGYQGIATSYFSKSGLLDLARAQGYTVDDERETIDQLHTDLRHGLRPARLVFRDLGAQLGAFVLYLKRFYQIDEVLLSGGILTAAVVDEMRSSYEEVGMSLAGDKPPSLRMLIVPGVLPEYNQVWSLAMNHFNHPIS